MQDLARVVQESDDQRLLAHGGSLLFKEINQRGMSAVNSVKHTDSGDCAT